VLIDHSPRVLGSFSEKPSSAAKKRLENPGFEVLIGRSVEKIEANGVIAGGDRIVSNTVLWTVGVAQSPASKWLNAESDGAGRVRVQKDLSVAGYPEILVVGDNPATLEEDGKPAPRPFRYFDKGNMAVVGKGFAALQSGRLYLFGFLAWAAWAAVHLQFLAQSNLPLSVFVQWV